MEKLFTRKEAAKILGISIATLDTARNNGLISYVQYVQNGCVYFTDASLQEYIAKFTHRAKPVDTHRAKPVEKCATYRKARSAGA
ncbi:helix-turn-helix domain-containing protein [Pseudoflavonifractor phocaeensis]|uniref:helix-turn-helix domain-containing protein n=1 Tax=Pseudoflavonifractor phocaeensis TaxID=1870988 RepID=UPI00195A2636|nr:helix-turn-helix domain-containing protein [Pseudoflavonifractor phocaeensis]MBM6871247.1 DNA-binding protein [Pseudoflavonifractor phocaeensis]